MGGSTDINQINHFLYKQRTHAPRLVSKGITKDVFVTNTSLKHWEEELRDTLETEPSTSSTQWFGASQTSSNLVHLNSHAMPQKGKTCTCIKHHPNRLGLRRRSSSTPEGNLELNFINAGSITRCHQPLNHKTSAMTQPTSIISQKTKKMTPYLLIGEGALLACWLQELDAICGSDGYGRINVVGSWGGRKMVHVNTTWENKDVFPWGPEELRDLKGKWALNRVPRVLHHCWSMVGCTGCGCAWNGNQCYCRHGHMSGIKWATCRLFVLVHLLVHIHRNTYYKCGVESSVHEQFIDLIYQKGMWLCSTIWHTQRIISHESYIENNLCTLKCIKHQRQLSLTNNLQTTSAKPTTSTQTT